MALIRIAEHSGACYGVERALEMVQAAVDGKAAPVYTLGPLIHNPRVVSSFEEQGIRPVASVDDAHDAVLILRTHGVKPAEEQRAREVCSEVIDATCPFVKRVHRAVERLEHEGFEVVVVGDPGHPEVEATLAHAEGACAIPDAERAREAQLGTRVGVVVQTTQSRAILQSVMDVIDDGSREVELVNTICEATSQRQSAASRLAAEVDVMVVLGGRNSANTTHLADICRQLCPRTYHIEDPGELEASWFAGAAAIGITAGASTPASQIAELLSAIEAMA